MISTLLLMLAVQSVQTAPSPAPMPAPPPVRVGKPLKALHPGDWMLNDDYPIEALQGGMQGMVYFALNVDASGAVKRCTVTKSSGWPLLDSKTCELLLQRAAFDPARDGANKPIESTYSGRFRWEIPAPDPIPAVSWRVSARMVVKADGSVTSCTLTKSGTPPEDAAAACDDLKGKSLWTELPVFGDLAGQPGIVTVDTMLGIDGSGSDAKGQGTPEQDVLATKQVAFEIAENGAIENCHAEDRAPGMVSTSDTPNCDIGFGPFKPVLGRDGKPKRTKGLLRMTVSAKLVPPPDPDSPSV